MTVSAGLGATIALLSPFQLSPQSNSKAGFGDLFKSGFQYGVSRPVNILVMGIDEGIDLKEERKAEKKAESPSDAFKSRSDTMLLVRLNPDIQKASLLTIPRDTQVDIPGLGVEKINAANWKGGPELAAEVVSHTLNGVEVDRYVRVSTGAFRDLVDVVGGVEVFVPREMKYDDNTQKLHIDLKPGLQTLDGKQAEGFVRFRHDDLGDIGRTQRQQMLMKALQKKFQNPLLLARVPEIFSVMQKHIDSNLSLGEMLALVQFGMQVKPNQFQMVMLPGRFSMPDEFPLSYWLMDRTATNKVMKTYFEVEPPAADIAETDTTSATNPADVKIVVQNASGDPEGSRRMADYLVQAGFVNVEIETDSPEPLNTTQVVPQWGNLEVAQQLQQKIPKSEVTTDSTGNLRSDITIRVGKDWVKQSAAPKS
ncbi:MAG: LCP family protein [Acaryochloridaceae cyanobacterium RU_4_10]|nr:LCP family protein [Acaryochloridaceae cyanobacterium RU_4_10]